MTQSEATMLVLAEGAQYTLLESPDGSTRLLRCQAEGLSALLSGADAERLKADYQTIRDRFPAWAADQVLAQLWDHGGYSWLATAD